MASTRMTVEGTATSYAAQSLSHAPYRKAANTAFASRSRSRGRFAKLRILQHRVNFADAALQELRQLAERQPVGLVRQERQPAIALGERHRGTYPPRRHRQAVAPAELR